MKSDGFSIHGRHVELVQGDITEQDTDAVINAANSALAGGGGVDGAIHRAGGPSIMEETRAKYPGGCLMGSAVITSGGNLKARHVIHAVGPVWHGGARGEDEVLGDAYAASFNLARQHGLTSVASPSLSTGAYSFPVDRAARIALRAAVDHLRSETSVQLIRFVLFDEQTLAAFRRAMREVGETATQST